MGGDAGAEIKRAQAAGDPDTGETYYRHWLNALERLVAEKGVADARRWRATAMPGITPPIARRTARRSSCDPTTSWWTEVNQNMAIYVILDNDIRDTKKYEAYKAAVPALIAKHGGKYLARDGKFRCSSETGNPTAS